MPVVAPTLCHLVSQGADAPASGAGCYSSGAYARSTRTSLRSALRFPALLPAPASADPFPYSLGKPITHRDPQLTESRVQTVLVIRLRTILMRTVSTVIQLTLSFFMLFTISYAEQENAGVIRLTSAAWEENPSVPTWNVLWKYHPGDDSTWALLDVDDRSWEYVDPLSACCGISRRTGGRGLDGSGFPSRLTLRFRRCQSV